MNSSGAGTNMLTVLGAERRLVFVGPAKDNKKPFPLSLCHWTTADLFILVFLVFLIWRMSDPSPRCRCYVVHWTDAPAVSSSADSSSEPPESLVSPDGTELMVKHTTKHQGLRFCSTGFSFVHAFKTDRD